MARRRNDTKKCTLLACAGAASGAAIAFGTARFLSGIASHVAPLPSFDPVLSVAVTPFLLGVALLAVYLPARRAARVDPMVALHYVPSPQTL